MAVGATSGLDVELGVGVVFVPSTTAALLSMESLHASAVDTSNPNSIANRYESFRE